MHLGRSWHHGNGEGAGNEKRVSECLRSDSFQNLWSCTQEIITKHCFLGYFAHSLNQTPPQKKKKAPCFFNRKLLACLLKIIGQPFFRRRLPRRPRGFIALAINSMIHDYHRLIGWGKKRKQGSSSFGEGDSCCGWWMLVDVGGWWFWSYCLVLLFFLSWFIVFFDSIHESPGTHRNVPCKLFLIRHVLLIHRKTLI